MFTRQTYFSVMFFLAMTFTIFTENNIILKSSFLKSNVPFLANVGQIDNHVKFYARTFGASVFITNSGELVYSMFVPKRFNSEKTQNNNLNKEFAGLAINEKFLNGKINNITGEDEMTVKVNFFHSKEPSQWKRNVPTFETVDLGEVYEGVNVKLKANNRNVEKLFYIKPDAKPNHIKIKVDGANHLSVNRLGELEAETEIGVISFTKPIAYQDYDGVRKYITVEYILDGHTYSFKTGNYDTKRTLVIDPLLASTFLGGSNTDDAYEPSISIDKDGNVYISGFTLSQDFPTTTGAYSVDFIGGASDRFISKFNSNLSKLLASTYIGGRGLQSPFIGGNGDELGHALTVDNEGNVYIAGYTESPDYPVTKGSFDESYNGGRDVYVSKFDSNLSTLIASTFLGGTGDEGFMWPRIDIAFDNDLNLIVAGLTHSVDFPTPETAFDRTFNGGPTGGDVFIAKFDKNLSRLLTSTYLGGNEDEWRVSVVTDDNGNIFVCGETESSNFPVTSGAYAQKIHVMKDIFISKFDQNLTGLSASTFFGGSGQDEALSMRVSEQGNIYITGYTTSMDFPTTPGAFGRKWNGGDRDAYIALLDNTLNNLIACTLFGGSLRDESKDLVLDEQGNVYVIGITLSPDFPTTAGAYDQTFNGDNTPDSFVSKFSANLNRLMISSYFGGSSADKAYCIEFGKNGSIYISGQTSSKDFPITTKAYDTSYNSGGNDCFIVVFDTKLSK